MNYLKKPSIRGLQKARISKSKKFIQNQTQINETIRQNKKNHNYLNEGQQSMTLSRINLPQTQKVKFNQKGIDNKVQGKILDEQMKMKTAEVEYQLEKSRIQDQNNAKTFRVRYPYGKQNVKITEDVLEKYKVNHYQDQKEMLKRFEQEAKQRKQIEKISKMQSHAKIQENHEYFPRTERRSIKKKTSILQRQVDKLYKAKQKYLKQRYQCLNVSEETSPKKHQEDKRLENIQNLLKDMKSKLQKNISVLTERQNQRQRQLRFDKFVEATRNRVQNLNQLSQQQLTHRLNLPVVIYNDQKSKRSQYANVNVCTDIQNYEVKQPVSNYQEHDKILKINRLNKLRLDRLNEKMMIKQNKSDIFG